MKCDTFDVMYRSLLILVLSVIFSCKHKTTQTKETSLNRTFTSISDLNDSYFSITEDNRFEYYKLLFDSVKNTTYSGSYKLSEDTLYLTFDQEDGRQLFGEKAHIDTMNNRIIFLDAAPESRFMNLFN